MATITCTDLSVEDQRLADEYQKKSEKGHILSNPDTYTGSIELDSKKMWIKCKTGLTYKTIQFIPALYKLCDEAIVNCRDHIVRMIQKSAGGTNIRNVTFIQIHANRETGEMTFMNDGNGIDVAMHPVYNSWIPQMIFGELRSGTNFNQNEKKLTGGKNGYGIKLCFVWSTRGRIETVDHIRGLHYVQEFTDNLDIIHPPTIRSRDQVTSKKDLAFFDKPFTKISFCPDYARFGIAGISKDFEALMRKRAFDLAGLSNHSVKKIKIEFNGEPVGITSFKQYVEQYTYVSSFNDTSSSSSVAADEVVEDEVEVENDEVENNIGEKKKVPFVYEAYKPDESECRWEYAVCISPMNEFMNISFVNGICTYSGGKHVEYILGQITTKLAAFIEKKTKTKVSPKSIKDQIMLFIRCDIENPAFDSQSKELMVTAISKFGSKCEVSDQFIEKLSKLGSIMDVAQKMSNVKIMREAKLIMNGSRRRNVDVEKLDDAEYAGTARGYMCTLILTEGDSAKSGAISGLSADDRKYIGVMALKGKSLNTAKASLTNIQKNEEIKNIMTTLGLGLNMKYTQESIKTMLRYGKVMILADQDLDGSHIKGLIFNLFYTMWRSLFEMPGFLCYMNTPIVKAIPANPKKTLINFYNQQEVDAWNVLPGYKLKYFKGLGTSTASDWKEYFRDKKVVNMQYLENTSDKLMDMVFGKCKNNDLRKQWVSDDHDSMAITDGIVSYDDFLNKEMVYFSMYDNERGIPQLMDGLKPSHRKILFCVIKRNLVADEIKVAQLSGYVSEHSEYHHGEASLNGTIVAMCQNFVGSNNINYLNPSGQFGTRLFGGNDAASPRYIFTRMEAVTRALFHVDDDVILNYLTEATTKIEPDYYLPILPTILLNGANGIGTGYSTTVLCYNPLDVLSDVRNKLNGNDISDRPELLPYYEGYTGSIVQYGDGRYLVRGKYTVQDDTHITITELPIGTWTDPYTKIFLPKLYEKLIKTVTSSSTDTLVNISIEFHPEISVSKMEANFSETDEGVLNELEKQLSLYKILNTNNMYLFNEYMELTKYPSANSIIDAYMPTRKLMYTRRKEHLLQKSAIKRKELDNRVRYITGMLNGTIDLRHKTSTQVDIMLTSLNFDKMTADIKQHPPSFYYLRAMQLDSVTQEKVIKLQSELNQYIENEKKIAATSETQMWLSDLNVFEEEYMKYKIERENIQSGGSHNSKDKTKEAKEAKEAVTKKRKTITKDTETKEKRQKKSN